MKRLEAQPDPLDKEPELRARIAGLGQEASELVRHRDEATGRFSRLRAAAGTSQAEHSSLLRRRPVSGRSTAAADPQSPMCALAPQCGLTQLAAGSITDFASFSQVVCMTAITAALRLQAVQAAKTVAELWQATKQMAPLTLGIDEAHAMVSTSDQSAYRHHELPCSLV